MESISDYEARLKQTQSRTRVRAQRVYMPDGTQVRIAPRNPWPLPILAACVGLVVLAGLVAVAHDDIARLFPASQKARQISHLDAPTPTISTVRVSHSQTPLAKPALQALPKISAQSDL